MSLSSLAESILQNAHQLENYARSPSFDNDTLTNLSPQGEEIRQSLVRNAVDLAELARGSLGPEGRMNTKLFGSFSDHFAIKAIAELGIAKAVPLEGSISYAEIAEKLDLNPDILTRLIRRAVTIHIFKEPTAGHVAHTADSRAMATDKVVNNMIISAFRSIGSYLWAGVDALKKWPHAEELNQTAYSLLKNTTETFYESFPKDAEAVTLFQDAMKYYARDLTAILDNVGASFPWETLGTGMVVDIGGGKGSHMIKLAERFPDLSFEVQDMEEVITGLEAPNHLASRFKYRAHNIFEEQPVKNADAYYLSQILHNWPDKYCRRILENIIPALKPGAKVLVCERILPSSPHDPTYRIVSEFDLQMFVCFNAKERSLEEFEEIFMSTDKRFKRGQVYKSPGGDFCIYEAIWSP